MKKIEWKYLLGLNQLYTDGKTKLKIMNNDYIRQILFNQKKLIRYKTGNHDIIVATERYAEFYKNDFLEIYSYYKTFFDECGIENNGQKKFTEDDIKALMFVYYNKEELRSKLTTQKKLSAQLFKNENSKYLENKPSLGKAILQLLNIDEFPEKDPKNQQWRFVVDCPEPKVIVLCENLDCLKVPIEYKKNNIELWYVGGNNTKPLLDISQDKLQLPIYYFCDWDYSGLNIYSQIKKIFYEKNKEIKIIQPPPNAKKISVNVKHHKSKWKEKDFSDLAKQDFTEDQINMIEQLISKNEWIEEESMELISLLFEKNEARN